MFWLCRDRLHWHRWEGRKLVYSFQVLPQFPQCTCPPDFMPKLPLMPSGMLNFSQCGDKRERTGEKGVGCWGRGSWAAPGSGEKVGGNQGMVE